MGGSAESILIVSDLHLHSRSDRSLASDFKDLLCQREEELLVINGDLFDLDQVAGEPRGGIGAMSAAARTGRILDAFPEVVEGMRIWAGRGGRILWLPGNHDAEICLDAVRQQILLRLQLPPETVRFGDDAYSENGVHIEHGHQHDPDNRYHPDAARALARERLSAFPLGCLTTRFLLCRLPDYQNNQDNHESPLAVLRRVWSAHRWSTPGMILLYIIAGLRITWQSFLARRRQDVPRCTDSTMSSPYSIVKRLYLDRIAMVGVLGAVMILGITGFSPLGLLAIGLPCGIALLVPPGRRRCFRFRDRLGCQLAASRRMKEGARVVIMGHTHHAEGKSDGRGTYLNPGSFLVPTSCGRPYIVVTEMRPRLEYLPLYRQIASMR